MTGRYSRGGPVSYKCDPPRWRAVRGELCHERDAQLSDDAVCQRGKLGASKPRESSRNPSRWIPGRPTHHNTLGDPLPTSPAWFSALVSGVDRVGFAAAVWDLDSSFGITCGEPGAATLCAADGVFP